MRIRICDRAHSMDSIKTKFFFLLVIIFYPFSFSPSYSFGNRFVEFSISNAMHISLLYFCLFAFVSKRQTNNNQHKRIEKKNIHQPCQVTSFCAMHNSFVRLLFVNCKNFMRANFNLIFSLSLSFALSIYMLLFFLNLPSSGF